MNAIAKPLLVLLPLSIACARSDRPAADTTTPVSTQTAWNVTPEGLGPVRVGMTVAQAGNALGDTIAVPSGGESCTYIRSARAPAGVKFMVVEGRIARVEVDSGPTATAEGARVGDAEASVQQLYAGRVSVQPHKYTDGHYLIVRPADPTRRIVFETDSGRVARYRAGMLPQVEWVEGCA